MGDSGLSSKELAERARKREAIGLSRQRPTAKAVIHSPPEAVRSRRGATIGLAVVAAAIAALVLWRVGFFGGGNYGRETLTTPDEDSLVVRDDFSHPTFDLPIGSDAAAEMGYVGDLYRISVQRAGELAWVTLGQGSLGGYRYEADLRLASQGDYAMGYGGLLVRYSNDDNFYLFAVDNGGRFKVELVEGGAWRTVQPWTESDSLSAGRQNILTVVDDGGSLRFAVNGVVVHLATEPKLPVGDVGLLVGARSQSRAQGLFDWAAIYDFPIRSQ